MHAAKKLVTSSQVSKAKCNHDRDEMMNGWEREKMRRREQAEQMSAPEDENKLEWLQRVRADKNMPNEEGGAFWTHMKRNETKVSKCSAHTQNMS